VANREDAADLLQELGVIVLARDDAPSEPRAFLLWCRGIAHNLALHHWRALRRYKDVFAEWDADRDSFDEGAVSVEDAFADRESLVRCVQDLDKTSRELLRLRYVCGKTSREIARMLRQSPEAVRMRIMRVREVLRHRIEEPDAAVPDKRLLESGAR
jgi:RNA polymerase sigma factor (sigma-70 family)